MLGRSSQETEHRARRVNKLKRSNEWNIQISRQAKRKGNASRRSEDPLDFYESSKHKEQSKHDNNKAVGRWTNDDQQHNASRC